jgi:hypothetical protein
MVQKAGTWTTVEAPAFGMVLREIEVNVEGFHLSYRTPFGGVIPTPESTRYRYALLGIREMLPYELNVWTPQKKVAAISWDADGTDFVCMTFHAGTWIDDFVAASQTL